MPMNKCSDYCSYDDGENHFVELRLANDGSGHIVYETYYVDVATVSDFISFAEKNKVEYWFKVGVSRNKTEVEVEHYFAPKSEDE